MGKPNTKRPLEGHRRRYIFLEELGKTTKICQVAEVCTNPGRHVVVLNNFFFTLATNICGFPVWNLLHIIFVTPIILRFLVDFWKKFCTPGLAAVRAEL